MTEETDLRKLLILRGPTLDDAGMLDPLRERFDAQVAEDLQQALEAMRHERFDAVLAETGDFLPLERAAGLQQASVVLDTLGDGVCVVGSRGELVWANRRLKEYPSELLDRVRDVCRRAYEQFAAGRDESASQRVRRFPLALPDGAHFEVICSAVRDQQGLLRQVAAVVVNVTRRRRQQLKLDAIDRAGRELVCIDEQAVRGRDAAERLSLLEERIIRCSNDVLDFQHLAVFLLNPRDSRLDVAIASGSLSETADSLNLVASPEGNGICGYVAATGRSYLCPDVRRDARYLSGLEGARSSLTVPLRLHDRIIGVINVESARIAAFNEEDRQFAEIFAHYVALALHFLNLLVVERHSTRTQLSGSISAELNGPLNDIITEVSDLVEDYIGIDDLRKRLHVIMDRASDCRRMVHELSDPDAVAATGAETCRQTDPVLDGRKVLIADDEEVIRETIRDVLIPCGCAVEMASDGASACEMVTGGGFDLVITDIKMPGATGYQVFSAAKTANSDTEVILITAFGYDPHHSVVRANREGLAAVLMKPFKVRQLLDECRAAFGGGREES